MAAGGRKLRPWLVAQVESGRFPGLVWDDPGRTALRIPWQHAGKGGARGGAGTALCQAWAEFKGRLQPGARPDPAGWKTRLRCALNKSPEFEEVPERSRPEGPRPYKVYRLLPPPPQRSGGGQPPKRGGSRPRKEEAGDGDPQPQDGTVPSPSPEEAPAEERCPDEGEPAEAPPTAPLTLCIEVDSPEPLPPAEGPACLCLRLWLGGLLAWQGRLPPGEFLLGPPPAPGSPPRPGLLPRLLLLPPPEGLPPGPGRLLAGLRPGLLLASTPRGLFLRRRPGPAPGSPEVHCRAPHAAAGPGGSGHGAGRALPEGELVQGFDAQRFHRELERHRTGLGPCPEHRVTLAVGQELGPHDGPHNRTLVLQLEQAFAQQLLDGIPAAVGPPYPPLTQV
ncbi:interferon regulatory factor 9-like [Grus japonensis]|uniref:Interferon regulatory factor 9-like n=1 Tax=Grus japonensis TaxID=30415 RepID=A0ABC9XX42_GRUJA